MPAGTTARVIPASLRSVASGETTRPADPAAPRRLTDVRPLVRPLEHYVLGRPGGTVGRTHLLAPVPDHSPGPTCQGARYDQHHDPTTQGHRHP